jgi:DNA-binding transcriptional LysR family regulator
MSGRSRQGADAGSSRPQIDLVRHMQYFLAVAEYLHFGRAAEALGMSQPPLSQGIQRLEARLGARLFDRAAPVHLTADGDALVPRARALIAAAEAITTVPMRLIAAVRLGMVAQVPPRRTAQLVRALRSTASAAPSVVTAPSLELVKHVAAAELDAALVIHPIVLDGVDAESSLVRLRRWALLPDSHPCARRHSVHLAELSGTPLATAARAENPAAHDLLRDIAAAAGLTVLPGIAADDRGALLAAASGRCIALTADPELAAPGCVLLELKNDPLPLRLRFVWTRDARRAPAPEVRAALIAAVTD